LNGVPIEVLERLGEPIDRLCEGERLRHVEVVASSSEPLVPLCGVTGFMVTLVREGTPARCVIGSLACWASTQAGV
jgi:hypothetical protein